MADRSKRYRSSRRGRCCVALSTKCTIVCIIVVVLIVMNFSAAQTARSRSRSTTDASRQLTPGNHTRNAAVLVSSSRYWHNYRHVSNVLSLYSLLKTGGGFADEDIILMIADDLQCDGRNPYKNAIYDNQARGGTGDSVYVPDGVEIDYRGTDVTVENFLRVLVGRHEDGETPSRMLRLTPETNLLVVVTGHGGDQFFKFQDGEELMTQDIMDAFRQMHKLGRYNEILFVADTCQAFTLNPTDAKLLPSARDVASLPNVMTVASSLKAQNSYAHHSDPEIGQSVVDRYTYNFVENMKNAAYRQPDSQVDLSSALLRTMEQTSVKTGWVDAMTRKNLGADVGWTDRGCTRKMHSIPLCDFLCDVTARRQQQTISQNGEDILLLTQHEATLELDTLERVLSSMESRQRLYNSAADSSARQCVGQCADDSK